MSMLSKRQVYDPTYPDGYDSWWWSSTGIAVRSGVVGLLFALVLGYFLGGYWHARYRLRKGLQPLSYHRWMVRRQMYYAAQYPYHQRPSYYNATNDAWAGDVPQHPAPPPAYNTNQAPPPEYQPGTEGGKIAADQHYAVPVHRAGEASNPAPAFPAANLQRL